MPSPDPPITPEQWRDLRRIFEEAVDLEVGERDAYLDRACVGDDDLRRRVEQMLRALDDESSLLERPAAAGISAAGIYGATAERLSSDSGADLETIGPYRLIERLGRGGMGEVFLAHREDEFHQRVAIKLLRRGGESDEALQRFRRERQILAGLEHPNVARLLDGGTTEEGRPYLVMEAVEGEPIDRYCRRTGLDLDGRIRLFLEICDAIQFAHQSLVVHRDLKPGNILVTADGMPKLLDFGIAKLLQPEDFPQTVLPTRTGLMPMTPAYASPEQVRGQAVTTASDVYALGVLLYELLTGRRPYEVDHGNLDTLVEAICHRDPPKPSTAVRAVRNEDGLAEDGVSENRETLRRRLSGDLDAIVLCALAKEPAERYASAAQLREDLQRHLDGHPVAARRGTALYHAGKFVRRHRWAVAGVAVLFASLLTFLGVLLDQQRRLLEENERRLVQQRRAETVSGWMVELFELPAPSRARGERITAREVLDKGAAEIGERFADQPALDAELAGTIGRTYAQLGLYPEGIELLRRSVERHEAAGDVEPATLATRLQQLSDALADVGEYDEALDVARRSLALRESFDEPAAEAEILARVGHLHDLRGDYPEALRVLDEALVLARRADRPEGLAKVLEYAAEVRARLGQADAARRLYAESLDLWEAIQGDRHPETVLLRASLAQVSKGRDAEAAEALFRQAIEEQRRLFDGAHPVIATALNNLGLLLFERARWAEARDLLDQALAMQVELLGEDHPKVAASRANLANAEAALGHLDRAETLCRRACADLERRLGADHSETGLCLDNLAGLALRDGRIDEAATLLDRAETILSTSLGAEHPRLAFVANSRGQVERARGDLAAAARHLERAVQVARDHSRAGDGEHPVLPQALFNLAVVLTEQGESRRAADHLVEVLDLVAERDTDPVFPLQVEARLADVWLELGELERAETVARRALAGWRRLAGDDNLWTLSTQATLGRTLVRRGELEEAEALLADRLDRLRATQPPGSPRLRRAIEHMIEWAEAAGDAASTERYRRRLDAFPAES